jgi:low affinity Fe/Cu permease
MKEFFRKFSQKTSELVGSPGAFVASVIMLLIWGILGPVFHYSDTWQLVINTITTVITFLIVFLIQNMQNREAKAVNLKLDELIRSIKTARNSMVNLEELSDDELERLQKQFKRISDRYARISNKADVMAEENEDKKGAKQKE